MQTIQTLTTRFRDIPSLDLEVLLAHCIHQPRTFLYTHPEYRLRLIEWVRFYLAIQKYKRGYPIAYITGYKEFFGLDFIVTKHTLVPRPDTEILVEKALQTITALATPFTLVDIGTGSGCIPISIAKHANPKPTAIMASDISRGALRAAQINNHRHGTAIQFVHGSLLRPLKNALTQSRNSALIITANLPYLRHDQFTSEPSIQREPYSALVAEDNGLALYDELLTQIKEVFTANKTLTTIVAFFEIDPSQTARITDYCTRAFPHGNVYIHKDLAERDRVIELRLKR